VHVLLNTCAACPWQCPFHCHALFVQLVAGVPGNA